MVSLGAELSLRGDPIFAADSIALTTADVSRGEPNWALMGETRLATRPATVSNSHFTHHLGAVFLNHHLTCFQPSSALLLLV
jgi:hypothetical protein